MPLESYDWELFLSQKEEKLRHIFLKCPFAKKLLESDRSKFCRLAKT
jgi:hypothetical protein